MILLFALIFSVTPLAAAHAAEDGAAEARRYQEEGDRLERERRFEPAAAMWEKAAVLRPGYGLYLRLGRAYALLGEFPKARSSYARARSLCPACEEAAIALGYFELRSGRPEEAKRFFEDAEKQGGYQAYHHLGVLLARERRYPEAEDAFRRALSLMDREPASRSKDPAFAADRAHTLGHLAAAYDGQGDAREAEVFFGRALAALNASPGLDAYATATLAQAADFYAARGRTKDAERLYRRVLRSPDKSPGKLSQPHALDGLAALASARDKPAEAAAFYRRALELLEKTPGAAQEALAASAGLAAAYERQGKDADRARACALGRRWLERMNGPGDAPQQREAFLRRCATASEAGGPTAADPAGAVRK